MPPTCPPALPPGLDLRAVEVVEGQLTWMVHIIGAVLRGRLTSTGADAQEALDGDLAARAFMLVRVADGGGALAGRAGSQSRQRLELALLAFFQSFRKVYIGTAGAREGGGVPACVLAGRWVAGGSSWAGGEVQLPQSLSTDRCRPPQPPHPPPTQYPRPAGEQAMHCSKVYSRLNERLGLGDHLGVMAVMLAKVATNLKAFGGAPEVVDQTLTLFQVSIPGGTDD